MGGKAGGKMGTAGDGGGSGDCDCGGDADAVVEARDDAGNDGEGDGRESERICIGDSRRSERRRRNVRRWCALRDR